MRNGSAKTVALGGVLAALAVVIFSLGGLIPVATYICPILCALLLHTVLVLCGKRIAWAWYGMVSVLALLLSPDKEAALVFLFLGEYPILKPIFDRSRFPVLWKLLLFNAAITVLYGILLFIIGMDAFLQDYRELGIAGMLVMLALGNATFFLLDNLLGRIYMRKSK